MLIVVALWLLAMVSGCLWSRWWTVLCAGAMAIAFIVTQQAALTHWIGWAQLLVLSLVPVWMVAARERYEAGLRALQREEASRMARLSENARALLSLQAATRRLEGEVAEITDVYHVTKETSRALHIEELFAISLAISPRLLNAKGLRLLLRADTPRVLRGVRVPDGRLVNTETGSEFLPCEEAILQQVQQSGQPASTATEHLPAALPDGISQLAWAPLWREERVIGALGADELPHEQLRTLAIVANQVSLQLSRIALYRQVEALAVTDALTGLYVRRHFLERAREELARSERHRLPCTLVMTDLDHFKQMNDAYGHLVGDAILKDVAQLLQRNLREVDLIARFGGEEFIMLLVETKAEHAMPVAQRLRQLVEIHPIRAYDELVTQTISVGMASFPHDGRTIEALIEQADQALYAAKRAGRNRVVYAGDGKAVDRGG